MISIIIFFLNISEPHRAMSLLVTDKHPNALEYVYMIREPEFVSLNHSVYKIGRTRQLPNSELTGYQQSSELVCFIQVDDCYEAEVEIMKIFKDKFEQMTDYGHEYFRGDPKEMLVEIYNIVTGLKLNPTQAPQSTRLIQPTEVIRSSEATQTVKPVESDIKASVNKLGKKKQRKVIIPSSTANSHQTRELNLASQDNKPAIVPKAGLTGVHENIPIKEKKEVKSAHGKIATCQCPYCDRGYHDKSGLRKHLKGNKCKSKPEVDNQVTASQPVVHPAVQPSAVQLGGASSPSSSFTQGQLEQAMTFFSMGMGVGMGMSMGMSGNMNRCSFPFSGESDQ